MGIFANYIINYSLPGTGSSLTDLTDSRASVLEKKNKIKSFLQRHWGEIFSSAEESHTEVGERSFLLGEAFAAHFCFIPEQGGEGVGTLPKQEAEPNLHPPAEQGPSLVADKELKHKTGVYRNTKQ